MVLLSRDSIIETRRNFLNEMVIDNNGASRRFRGTLYEYRVDRFININFTQIAVL